MVLDILVQSRRATQAAKRLLRKLLRRQCRAPRVMVTDKQAYLDGIGVRSTRMDSGRSQLSCRDAPIPRNGGGQGQGHNMIGDAMR